MMTTIDEFEIFNQLENTLNETNINNQENNRMKNEMNKDNCSHENISNEYGICICLECGIELKNGLSNESKMYSSLDNRSIGDGNRCWAPKRKTKSIRDDVKDLGIPDSVINEADSIFKTVTNGGIYRSDKRRSIIANCVFEAYKILGERVSFESLLEKFNLSNATIGMRLVETKIKEYDKERKRITHTSPIDSIYDILNGWESDKETIEKIIELYKKIEDKSSMLNRSRAKSVAAAVVYYYALVTKRKNIKLKEFSKRVSLSESTITKNAKEISAILQTPDVLSY